MLRPNSHTQLPNNCAAFFMFFSFFFGDVSFSEYFKTIAVFSLYGEYVVRFPPFRVMFFLPCNHGLDFFYQLM